MRRNHLAILMAAGSLAFGLAAIAPERAEARPKNPAKKLACEAKGYLWNDTKGCADKTCKWNGDTYEPGDSITIGKESKVTMYCDGFLGAWRVLIQRPPSSNLQPVRFF